MRYHGDMFQFVDEENSLVNLAKVESKMNQGKDSSSRFRQGDVDRFPYDPFDASFRSDFEPGL